MGLHRSTTAFRAAVLLIAALGLIAPIAAGLWQVAGASFGYLPALSSNVLGFAAWREILASAGFGTALRITLLTGFAATAIALAFALSLATAMAAAFRAGRVPLLAKALAPLLAIPHAAMAVGLGFLLSPSGWISRALAPVFGVLTPPNFSLVGDASGFGLILGLALKETPFLLLVILAALPQLGFAAQMRAGQSLFYSRGAIWLKIIAPQLWPRIRLPVFVVLVYGLSVVDMALILGPTHPPPLAVLVARRFSSPDLAQLLPASAGAMVLALLVAGSVAALWVFARGLGMAGLIWVRRGSRGEWPDFVLALFAYIGTGLLALGALAMVALAVWSFAWRWSWPHIWPEVWSLQSWARGLESFSPALATTALVALLSTAVSLVLAVMWLDSAPPHQRGRRADLAAIAIYLPLLVPQISFLFGMNMLLLRLGLGSSLGAVIWGHVLFVFPYVMIALTGPWRGLDPRYAQSAAALGASHLRIVFAVKLPILLAPLSAAAAIGVAVSVAQFLPTLFLGGGRVTSLTTEAVTLAASSDRRITAVVTSLQAALPLAAYFAAFALPAWRHKNRRDVKGVAG